MSQSLFVRRCHVCGDLNESTEDILKCNQCQKPLLPFFYFDKKKIAEYSDNQARPEEIYGAESKSYGPIRGLTAYW